MTTLIAARINRNDTISLNGSVKTVDDYETLQGAIRWTFTDGTTATVSPLRRVEVAL